MFSIYRHIELQEIYVLKSRDLEPLFKHWEAKLDGSNGEPPMTSINNPKIPIKFVTETGTRIYPFGKQWISPADIVRR